MHRGELTRQLSMTCSIACSFGHLAFTAVWRNCSIPTLAASHTEDDAVSRGTRFKHASNTLHKEFCWKHRDKAITS